MNALLFCNGEPPSGRLCRSLAGKADFILAADGGANIARRYGIRPDCIIGDLDSITPGTRRFFRNTETVRVPTQESTDFEKALAFLRKKGVAEVTIVGATGKRLDFTLGNLASFWKFTRNFGVTFAGDNWTACPVGRRTTLRARRGTTVSLLPFGACSGITLRGLRYPLRNATMRPGDIGVSNVVKRSPFSVSVRRGRMLLIMIPR
ncbi:MAG: thiamine diphosphokinase [Ignavibacteria bacterium]|nr:thiamine diphosphokinase [Ignavibacteria bacterium]